MASIARSNLVVSDLREGLGFSPVDRAMARERCSGSFWIVGEVPDSSG